jgi:hypothetical protein
LVVLETFVVFATEQVEAAARSLEQHDAADAVVGSNSIVLVEHTAVDILSTA